LFHQFLKINVGCGYNSNIDLYGFIPAQRGKRFFLEET